MKKRTLIILILFLVPLCYLVIKSFINLSKIELVNNPKDHSSLFVETSGIKSSGAISKAEDTLSSYFYKGNDYGIAIFKKSFKKQSINSNISVLDGKKSIDYGKSYTGSIFMDYFNYHLDDKRGINNLSIFIENFKDSYVIERTNERLYLYFPINKTLAIEFNNSNDIDLQVQKKHSKYIEYNELMILKKDDYLYFIYLKPFRDNMEEKFILKKLIR